MVAHVQRMGARGPSFTAPGLAACLLASLAPASAQACMGPQARASLNGAEMSLSTAALGVTWRASADGLSATGFEDRQGGHEVTLATDAFVAVLKDGSVLRSGALHLATPPRLSRIEADPAAIQGAAQQCGWRLDADLSDTEGRLAAHWTAQVRDGASYVRQTVTLKANSADLPIVSLRMIDLVSPDLKLTGSVRGSPLAADNTYFGLEHPAAETHLAGRRGFMQISRELPLKAGHEVSYSAVMGVTAPGQLRRGFQAYLEAERARPYRTFLHYNSWYDIGYFSKYDEADALDAIHGVGEALAVKRGVKLDSFLFDDGWDDLQGEWRFHAGFPNGFDNLKAAAAQYGAAPGVWLSPWGGYGKPKKARLENGAAKGLETNAGGFVLSGPAYYEVFRKASLGLLQTSGVNQFKIDGAGNADSVFPGAAFDSDFQAAISLIGEWRKARPDLYVNLTTGTYPSPFWLPYADSIWRGGDDHDFLGVGSWRQRWITYRDADTYAGVVSSGSLYPLNSLMLHGLIYARHAKHLDSDPGHDFTDEVRSYFGTGTQLQELYVSHGLLSDADWDAIAQAAKWSRANADVLRDTHWIGGDPSLLEVYGWASWAPRKGIVVLRNPSDKAQDYVLDLSRALELPDGARGVYRLSTVWPSDPGRWPQKMEARARTVLHLKPFEVVGLEALPEPRP